MASCPSAPRALRMSGFAPNLSRSTEEDSDEDGALLPLRRRQGCIRTTMPLRLALRVGSHDEFVLIKYLIQLPLSSHLASFVVHCIGRTLLVDECLLYSLIQVRRWSWADFTGCMLRLTYQMKRALAVGRRNRRSRTKLSSLGASLWAFEDIRKQIRSDLAIFGDARDPSVSVRLRHMQKPILFLTGRDYWLESMMCRVPEVVMRFHLNQFVQQYETFHSEELPLEADQSAQNVARNILTFYRHKSAVEGHTYWLFRDNEDYSASGQQMDEIVKLYDLTVLCDNQAVLQAPAETFRTAVSMLLYKVAKSLLIGPDRQKEVSNAFHLLIRCLSLLDVLRFPGIGANAHYMLAGILLPDDALVHHVATTGFGDAHCRKPFVLDLPTLLKPKSYLAKSSLPLDWTSNLVERCLRALHHIRLSFKALSYEKTLDCFWKCNLSRLLAKKAFLAYTVLAKVNLMNNKCGQALKCVKIGLAYVNFVEVCFMDANERNLVISLANCVAGDAYASIAPKLDGFVREFIDTPDIVAVKPAEWDRANMQWPNSQEDALRLSQKAYLISHNLIPAGNEQFCRQLLARKGGIQQLLAVFYISLASKKITKKNVPHEEIVSDLDKAKSFIMTAVSIFEELSDSLGCAKAMSIMAKVHGFYADCSTISNKLIGSFTLLMSESESFTRFNESIECYLQALAAIGSRKKSPLLWTEICWGLSSMYYKMATHMLNNAVLSGKVDYVKDIVAHYMKAQKYCDPEGACDSAQWSLFQRRCGLIHFRLGALYQHCLRLESLADPCSNRLFQLKQLAESHYDLASGIFAKIDNVPAFFKCQMDRITLREFLMDLHPAKKKFYPMLELFVETKSLLPLLHSKLLANPRDAFLRDWAEIFVCFFSNACKTHLLALYKSMWAVSKRPNSSKRLDTVKQIYLSSLQLKPEVSADFIAQLITFLTQMSLFTSNLNKNI